MSLLSDQKKEPIIFQIIIIFTNNVTRRSGLGLKPSESLFLGTIIFKEFLDWFGIFHTFLNYKRRDQVC